MGVLTAAGVLAPAAVAEEMPTPVPTGPGSTDDAQGEPAPVLNPAPSVATTAATGAHFGTGKLALTLAASDDGAPADADIDPTGASVRVHFDVIEGVPTDVTGTCTLDASGWCAVPADSPLPTWDTDSAEIPADSEFTLTLAGAPTAGGLMAAGATVVAGWSDTTPGPNVLIFTEAQGTITAPGAYRTLGVALTGTGSMAGATFTLAAATDPDPEVDVETATTDETGTATFSGRHLPGMYSVTQTSGPGGTAVATVVRTLTVPRATSVLERRTPVLLPITGVVGPALAAPAPSPTPSPTPTPATPAPAAPSPATAPTSSVTAPTIAPGAVQTVTLSGFQPGETVHGVLHSTPIDLGTVTADAQGRATFTFTIPAGFEAGRHDVTMTGLTSNVSASVEFTVSGAPAAAARLASTGATVLPLLGVGGLLLVAGGGALVAARRRSA